MDRQARTTIQRLCEKPELREKAELLFHSLKARTARGSGFELNNRSIALPAIVSLLASEELGYVDVTEKVAQAASCLGPKEFNSAVATVRKALASAELDKNSYKITYDLLVAKYKHVNPELMVQYMKDVEAALMLGADLRGHLRPPNDIVTITIYVWTLNILGLKRPSRVKEQGVHEDDYQEVVDALEICCQDIKKDIQQQVKALRAHRRGRNDQQDPSQKSPSKSALRDTSRSPTKTPTHKRKVAFSPTKPSQDDESSGVEDTPSKRQKYSTPMKYRNSSGVAAFQQALRNHPSSSKTPIELLEDQSENGSVLTGEPMDDNSSVEGAEVPPSDHSSDAGTDIPNTEMSDDDATSETASDVDVAHLTPRRGQRQKKPSHADPPLTPSRSTSGGFPSKSRKSQPIHSHMGGDTGDTGRRCRPILLEHRQWAQRDGRVEEEHRLREQWVREQIAKRGGHPFESLRASSVV